MNDIKIKTITVVVDEPSLADFLADTNDVETACEQYRAEYERRLDEQYPDTLCMVELGETNGMGDDIYINGELNTAGSGEFQDEVPWIEYCAIQMVNDWELLTVV